MKNKEKAEIELSSIPAFTFVLITSINNLNS